MRKLQKILVFACLILSTAPISGVVRAESDVGSKRIELIEVINDELREIIRLSKQKSHGNPDLLLRIAELNLEKARLYKEEENKVFLALDPKQRTADKKRASFATSSKYYLTAQKTCIQILKRFKDFKNKGEVLYILAFNAKEFQQFKKSKQYFSLSLKYTTPGSDTALKSKLAYAELLYNDGEFLEALPLYMEALDKAKNKKDKWYTKDSFNLAWCYYHAKRYDEGIRLMREVHALSKDSRFVDMTKFVEKDIGILYAEAGKVDALVSFYKDIGIEPGDYMYKLGRHLVAKGRIVSAQQVFLKAQELVKTREDKIGISIQLLEIYEKLAKVQEHLKLCKELVAEHKETPLSAEDLETLTFNVKKMAAVIQKQVIERKSDQEKTQLKAQWAVEYFQLVAQLENKTGQLATLHSAETYYSVRNIDKAIPEYARAFDEAEKAGDAKTQKLAIIGILAALGEPEVSPSTQAKYLIPAYEKFLKLDSTSPKANKIYQKIFTFYLKKNDIRKCEEIFGEFRQKFPNDQAVQEGMLSKIISDHQKNKNKDGVVFWVNEVKEGKIKVSQKYAKNLNLLLLSYQFDSVEKLTTKGQKKDALEGYYRIFKDPQSQPGARKNAAYNVAILYHELGRTEQTYNWTKIALDMMNPEDVKKFENDFLTLTRELFNRRKTQQSAELSERILDKLCKTKSDKKNTFFQNAHVLYVADGQIDAAIGLSAKTKECGISEEFASNAEIDGLKALLQEKRLNNYSAALANLERDQSKWPLLIKPYFDLRNEFANIGRKEESDAIDQKIMKFYSGIKGNKKDIPIDALDVVAHIKLIQVEKTIARLKREKLQFPDTVYNATLKVKLKILDELTTQCLDVLSTGSGKGVVKAYQYLVETYQSLVLEIRNFTPEGKGEAYVQGFKSSMEGIVKPILAKSLDFLNEAKKQIVTNNIMSTDNYWFFSSERLPIKLDYRYEKEGVIMDKGGRR